jgi:DNA-binding MarR family transcriptional regulator
VFPSPHKNDADASVGLLFICAYNKWHTRIKKELREIGITHPQFVVMTTLAYLTQNSEFISQARVAAMADMDEMSVSQIVRTLNKSGFLTRSDNPTDTHSYAMDLTEKGRAAVKTALPIIEGINVYFFSNLGKDKAIFLALLHQLVKG